MFWLLIIAMARERSMVLQSFRLKSDGAPDRFRTNDDGETKSLLYSPWVIGLTEDEIPKNNKVSVVLQQPLNAQKPNWLRLITAVATFASAGREPGENFRLYPRDKDQTYAFWLGLDAEGNKISNGHAFVYRPENPGCDLSQALDHSPYEIV